MSLIVIDDSNWQEHVDPIVNGTRVMRGLRPRNRFLQPFGTLQYAAPFDMPLIPRNEWVSRLRDLQAMRATLKDMRETGGPDGGLIPARDQGRAGYCWCHSTVSAMLLMRAMANMPYVDLSPYAIGCIIKNYRNQGGWGGESVQFATTRGCPTSQFWPQQSWSRSNDNPATWENAKLHLVTEWMELDTNSPQYIDQFVTCLLLGFPLVSDFNWWGHSVATMSLEQIDPADVVGSLITWILNSWGDSWSEKGAGQLKGRKAIPDDAIALRVTKASIV